MSQTPNTAIAVIGIDTGKANGLEQPDASKVLSAEAQRQSLPAR